VHAVIDALEVEGIPTERIIIGGFGQGAALVAHSVTRYKKPLCAGVMLCGYVPCIEEIAERAATTTLTAPANPGDKKLEVASTKGFTAGEAIRITQPPLKKSAAVIADDCTIMLESRLRNEWDTYNTGDEVKFVLEGAKGTLNGLNSKLFWIHGARDAVVHPDVAIIHSAKLKSLGVQLEFRMFPELGFGTSPAAIKSIEKYMTKQLEEACRPPPEEPAEEGAEEGAGEGAPSDEGVTDADGSLSGGSRPITRGSEKSAEKGGA